MDTRRDYLLYKAMLQTAFGEFIKPLNKMTEQEKLTCFNYALESGEYSGDFHNFELAMGTSLFNSETGKIVECG